MKKMLLTCLCCCIAWSLSLAQIETPAASPFCKIEQKVGLTDVTIEYSRPSVKDRTIFADDGLVSYGDLWRTGANAATKITFSDNVTLGGQKVAAGSYAILTKPMKGEWTVHLYKYEDRSWASYRSQTPDVRLMAKAQKTPMAVESMLIFIDNLRDESATIELLWGDTHVSMPLEVETDERVIASIEQAMKGTTRSDYYTAASYYYNTGRDMQQALQWIQLANKGNDQKFWQVRRESQILAALGRYKEAIAAAERSLVLAREAGNNEYVRFNAEAIEEWKGKL